MFPIFSVFNMFNNPRFSRFWGVFCLAFLWLMAYFLIEFTLIQTFPSLGDLIKSNPSYTLSFIFSAVVYISLFLVALVLTGKVCLHDRARTIPRFSKSFSLVDAVDAGEQEEAIQAGPQSTGGEAELAAKTVEDAWKAFLAAGANVAHCEVLLERLQLARHHIPFRRGAGKPVAGEVGRGDERGGQKEGRSTGMGNVRSPKDILRWLKKKRQDSEATKMLKSSRAYKDITIPTILLSSSILCVLVSFFSANLFFQQVLYPWSCLYVFFSHVQTFFRDWFV